MENCVYRVHGGLYTKLCLQGTWGLKRVHEVTVFTGYTRA